VGILKEFLFSDLSHLLRLMSSCQAKRRQLLHQKPGRIKPIKLKLEDQSSNKRNLKGLQIPSRLSMEVHLLRIPSSVCFVKIKREDHPTQFLQLDSRKEMLGDYYQQDYVVLELLHWFRQHLHHPTWSCFVP
jgi:hypothetical protein